MAAAATASIASTTDGSTPTATAGTGEGSAAMKIGRKTRRAPAPRGDDSRPAKPAAPPAGSRPRAASGDAAPSYAGRKKTDKKPRGGGQPHERTKTPWRPGRGQPPPPASGDSVRGDQIPPSAAP